MSVAMTRRHLHPLCKCKCGRCSILGNLRTDRIGCGRSHQHERQQVTAVVSDESRERTHARQCPGLRSNLARPGLVAGATNRVARVPVKPAIGML